MLCLMVDWYSPVLQVSISNYASGMVMSLHYCNCERSFRARNCVLKGIGLVTLGRSEMKYVREMGVQTMKRHISKSVWIYNQ